MKSKWSLMLLSFLSGCYREQHYALDTPNGQIPVTESAWTLPVRERTLKYLALPDEFKWQVAAYRRRYGFFPLSLQGLAAASDSALASVTLLREAGFVEAEFTGGGQADSATLEIAFETTHRWVTTKATRSRDNSINQAAKINGDAISSLHYGRFVLSWSPEHALLLKKQIR